MAKYPYPVHNVSPNSFVDSYKDRSWDAIPSQGGDDFQEDDFIEEGNTEGLLQKIIRSGRVGEMPISPIGMLPKSGAEAMDIGRVGLENTLGMVNPFQTTITPMSIGAGMASGKDITQGIPQIEEALKPKTPFGGMLDTSAKGAMLAMGAPSAFKAVKSGAKGLASIFKNPSLIEGEITDLKNLSPERLKLWTEAKLDKSGRIFGEKLAKAKGSLSHKEFSDVLMNAANDYGETEVAGSAGNKLMALAEEFAAKGNMKMKPSTVQAQYRRVLELMPDKASKAILNNHYGAATEIFSPELAMARKEHSALYDIAKASRKVNKTLLKNAAGVGETLGQESYNELRQLQSRLGSDAPDYIQKAMDLGEKFKSAKRTKKMVQFGGTAAATVFGLPWFLSRLPQPVQNVINNYPGIE